MLYSSPFGEVFAVNTEHVGLTFFWLLCLEVEHVFIIQLIIVIFYDCYKSNDNNICFCNRKFKFHFKRNISLEALSFMMFNRE